MSPAILVDPSGEIVPILAGAIAFGVYMFWPDNANAPAPGDPIYPSDPHGGLIPAVTGAAAPELAALEVVDAWLTDNGLQEEPPEGWKIGMCPAPGRFGKKPKLPGQITRCEARARQIQRVLGGEIHTIKPKTGGFLGPVKGEVPTWRSHDVVVKNGRVYDDMTGPSGVPIDEYKKFFEYWSDILFGF